MPQNKRESIYDRLRPRLDALDLISRLGLKVSRTSGSEAYLAPLCHESTSGESLQVNLHTGRWNCKACQASGVYGDLIQLVEYVLTRGGAPSRGATQGGSASHREAITWLCDQFGIAFDENKMGGDAGLDVVHTFAMAAHKYLLSCPEVLEWIQSKWGFDLSTVEAYGLGYMPDPILPSVAREAGNPSSRDAFRSSGLGWFEPGGGRWQTRFAGRVLFPYLEHGRAVYLIGRATPWTPKREDGGHIPKYHKLSVHSDTRRHVSERITNDHLYNEPVMATAEEVGVLEGVADAVAISAIGESVVSPVTISFNATDLERFIRKCHENGIKRVWILFDNELSGSGNWAARRVGVKLVEGGLAVKIATLPLGAEQERAREEVMAALGTEVFGKLEQSDPRARKTLIAETITDDNQREWITQQVQGTKIDAAEWCAGQGAAAPVAFKEVRRNAVDVIELEVATVAEGLDMTEGPSDRAFRFGAVISLAAHVEDRLTRQAYAGIIARAAGKGIGKTDVGSMIAKARRDIVKPKRAEQKEEAKKADRAAVPELVLLPPEMPHTQPAAPAPPPSNPNAPPAPPPPGKKDLSEHERYAPARQSVAKAVEQKMPAEPIGEFVAQTIMRSMGYTPFRTPEDLYLVRGNIKITVGLIGNTSEFKRLLQLAAGLTSRKPSHGEYIAMAQYFLENAARKADNVSWSFIGDDESVYFPQGDRFGSILKIEPGRVTKTKMAEVRIPAVAGGDFQPFQYVDGAGGIESILGAFTWTSISPGDRLILVYWIAVLPILRRIGTVPIIRIEGGSSSGKTRTVDAVSYLVNGQRSSSVPTAAALASRMSSEMLTIDDNREAGDVNSAFRSTLLQATQLGAREKRRGKSDTETIIERICGALLMNGIEPIHDGRSELASRILTLRCDGVFRASGSPTANAQLMKAIVDRRPGFWSDSAQKCAAALALDQIYGEALSQKIEELFDKTRIGRLSAYIRIMYLAWVAGLDEAHQPAALADIAQPWADALSSVSRVALDSLIAEELTVTALRYVFSFGNRIAEKAHQAAAQATAWNGKYVRDDDLGTEYVGPVRASHLARLVREAAREMNGPRSISYDLTGGQLESRLLDGEAFMLAGGFEMSFELTAKHRKRFTFKRENRPVPKPELMQSDGEAWLAAGGDTWVAP